MVRVSSGKLLIYVSFANHYELYSSVRLQTPQQATFTLTLINPLFHASVYIGIHIKMFMIRRICGSIQEQSTCLHYTTEPRQPKNNGYTHTSIYSVCLLLKLLFMGFPFHLVKRSCCVGMVSLRPERLYCTRSVRLQLGIK